MTLLSVNSSHKSFDKSKGAFQMSCISHQQYSIFIILSLLVIYGVLLFVEKIELNVSIVVIKRINKILTSLFSATTVNRLSTMDIITASDINADIKYYVLKILIGNYKKGIEKKWRLKYVVWRMHHYCIRTIK